MSKVVTLRLPEATAERLKKVARRAGRSVSETGARSIEEWLRQQEFADIEFREFQGQRLACLKGSIRLWKLIMAAQDYDLDPARTAEHLQLPVHRVQAALNYYAAYPEEIDRMIAENDAVTFEDLQRVLPSIRLTTIVVQDDADPLTP
ncbi:MAG: ribbon-helix-helix protein, CopG family [Chloroflexi bacterium]|nr:ribbon-helix-helix protein, CopG family [Chloroflexota bacterium]